MTTFSRLICFESADGETYFADLSKSAKIPATGSSILAYSSYDGLTLGKSPASVVISKFLPPLPRHDLPIYCVGLNFRSHAVEAGLKIPRIPPLWTKPAAALASPEEDISMSNFCASNFPDWEGEIVFVTSKECCNVTPEQAESYILGYSAGNDLSCRVFQMPEQAGGQFFYAKAFDKFAPIGPVLVSPDVFSDSDIKLTTRVNGEVMQNASMKDDMVFSPAKILSSMSQSTTIPAFTAIMTGTPAGVGAFRKPRQFLKHNDVVEVEVTNVGILRNKILFQDGQQSVL